MTRDQESRLCETCVVIPTFNESQNLARLCYSLRGLSSGMRIVVVDDNSPDGTGALADQLSRNLGPMEVLHRPGKRGRGSACLEGFRRALAMADVRRIVEMDADLSHDPRELQEMLKALEPNDVVIRSRYLEGSVIEDWTLARRVLSRVANRFIHRMLGIPLTDFTNGYRAYSRRAVEALDLDRIDSRGYIVLSEVAYQLHRKGFHFQELPTRFVSRRRGESNLTLREIAGAFWGVCRLGLRNR